MKMIAALLILVSLPAYADDWNRIDTYREAAYQSALLIDALQTHEIVKNPAVRYEQNNVLGMHPTMYQVNRYFAELAILHAGISFALPEKYRSVFQYSTLAIEVGYVAHNYSVGIRVPF